VKEKPAWDAKEGPANRGMHGVAFLDSNGCIPLSEAGVAYDKDHIIQY
jgi:hypothetical protein